MNSLSSQQPDQKRKGALVIGTNYRALGVVRSLGRHRIPVWVFKQGDQMLASLSRYADRCLPWPEGNDQQIAEQLMALGRKHGLQGWVLWPTDDECTHLIAHYHALLGQQFTLINPSWHTLQPICDKRLMYRLASDLGISQPRTFFPRNRDEMASTDFPFPVILKPAVRETSNPLPLTKAWPARDHASLLEKYDTLCAEVDPALLMVQELIPGTGESQFSYGAVYDKGRALAGLTVKRTRQYPADLGRFSTYVESIQEPAIIDPAVTILSFIQFTGIAEVEFKYDHRDRAYKLLDINPRVWGWHTLGQAAGIDFSYLLWLLVNNYPLPSVQPTSCARWVRMSSDLPVAILEILHGRLSWSEYLRSMRGPIESAILAKDDLLPGLCEIPLLAYTLSARALGHTLMRSARLTTNNIATGCLR